MNSTLLSFYLTFSIVILCVLYAGLDETLILVEYSVKKVRFWWVLMRLWWLKQGLRRGLEKDRRGLKG